MMKTNIRGEMTTKTEYVSNQTISLAVGTQLHATSKRLVETVVVRFISRPREVNLIDNTLNVAMMCTAAVLHEPYCTDLFANLVIVLSFPYFC